MADTHPISPPTGGSGLGLYRPLPGTPDEMMDAQGRIRPVWARLAAHLDALGHDRMAAQLARADQYLLDSGVFYRQYGTDNAGERQWPFSHIPVLIEEAEWGRISAALMQRADLLEAVMADLYGANRLVAGGRLPAEVIAGNSEWLRPLVGVPPRSGHHLHFLAFELGRGPRGGWWVLADRTQAPSGAGYALENRVATKRAFADLYARENVHRLAGFYRDFRDALLDLRADRDSRVGILSPGPLNETYFEHAYIARYLGFTLVQGEDLTVVNGRMMVRTVSGLRPLDVLWRRLDSGFADPMELNSESRIGTPGMVSALRAGGLSLVNALGSGVLESRAMMAFLPKLAAHLTGRQLAMPNIATWWCGDADACAQALAAQDRMVLAPALSAGTPFDAAPAGTRGTAMSATALRDLLDREGAGLVAQEAVTLSTTPTLVAGQLVPRPVTVRVYLARTADGWTVMPGGFARIGASPDPAAVAMSKGGHAADVWIVSPRPVPKITLAQPPDAPVQREPRGSLPARAADNLFWLGRYVERAEGMIRLLRAYHARLAEAGHGDTEILGAMTPLLRRAELSPDQPLPVALLDTIDAAIGSAGRVRDRFSPDAWSALDDIARSARAMARRVTPGDDAASAHSRLLRKMAGISGLVHENMYRFLGWRFLSMGRLHERATAMTAILATLADPGAAEGALDLAVELGDSVLTHRRRFVVATRRNTVVDLLALDPLNPRSVRHQIDALRHQIDALPGAQVAGSLSPLSRAALRLYADLATFDADELDTAALQQLQSRIGAMSDLMTRAYFH